ncbi:secreted protein [Streptomyces albidoflavus]|nr:secreted protein [Streptomyces albidoflavus]
MPAATPGCGEERHCRGPRRVEHAVWAISLQSVDDGEGVSAVKGTEAHGRTTDRVGAAQEAVDRLRAGLAEAGIVLPSLRLEPVSSAGNDPAPLVDLGRCNVETADRLSAVLEGARQR